MTDYKILGQSKPSTNVETDLYTVPDSKSTVVRAINVTNSASASDTFDIALIDNVSLVENPTFVAVANSSASAAYSTDAITWSITTMPLSSNWSNIVYDNQTFIVGSRNSNHRVVAVSTNGITWVRNTLPSPTTIIDIAYGNGFFVGVPTDASGNSRSNVSTDGITWTQGTLPNLFDDQGQPTVRLKSIAYGNSIFVAVGYFNETSVYTYSTNGIVWQTGTHPFSGYWGGVTYGNGKFVAVAGDLRATISTNGVSWTITTMPLVAQWYGIVYGNSVFVAIENYPGVSSAVSTDAITWTQGTLPVQSYDWKNLSYGNGKFVAVAGYSFPGTNIVATSTNGITWTQGTMPYTSQWISSFYGTPLSLQYPSTTNADYIFKSHDILPNETITIKGGYTLDSNNKIRIKSTNGESTFHAFGGEI